jgi:methyltransferase
LLDSRLPFTFLVAFVALQRLLELRLSKRNQARALAAGGYEAGAGHYPWMVALHTGFLLSAVAEVWLLGRPFLRPLAWTAFGLLVAAQMLRVWAIRTLGERWTTRIVIRPGLPLVDSGPFRFLRHPNYLAVVTEIVALPLVHTAWLTAVVFSLLNAALLAVRIRAEEAALAGSTPG